MASIRIRYPTGKSKRRKPSYAVLYRSPDGRQTSLTVDDEQLAQRLKRWIEADGEAAALERLRLHLKRNDGATVDDLVTAYLDWKQRRVRSDRTVSDYRRDHRLHISPAIGHRPAVDITSDDIQEWIDDLADRRSAKTVTNIYASVLAPAFKWAATRARPRLVETNPCEGVDLPERRRTPPKGLRAGEWPVLYQAAVETWPDVADLLLFLAGTGWRWGETAALDTWQIETVEEVVLVRVAQVVRRDGAGRIRIVADAKSEAGYDRVLSLSPAVGQMVLRRTDGNQPGDPVFTSDTGVRWRYNNFYNRYWKRTRPPGGRKPDDRPRVLERATKLGLMRADQITPHWLRHTNVAMLNRAGATLPETQRRIGHDHIATTIDVYGRGIDDTSADVLEKLDDQLLGKTKLRLVGGDAAE